MPHFYVVGPDADSGNILMAMVLNECKDLPAAPQTEFLLIVQCLVSFRQARLRGGAERSVRMENRTGAIYQPNPRYLGKRSPSGRAIRKLSDRGTPGLEGLTAGEWRSGGEVAPRLVCSSF